MLAKELHMPVGEMLKKMPSTEITEWKAFFILEHEDIEAEKSKSEFRKKVKR